MPPSGAIRCWPPSPSPTAGPPWWASMTATSRCSTSTCRATGRRCSLPGEPDRAVTSGMDGGLFEPILTTDALLLATGDRAWLQALLDGEAALAAAQAEVGLFGEGIDRAIPEQCEAARFHLDRLRHGARDGGNPVIPLVSALRAMVPDDARPWVHHGATSQDVVDSAAMLV